MSYEDEHGGRLSPVKRAIVYAVIALCALIGGTFGSQLVTDAVNQGDVNASVKRTLIRSCLNDAAFRSEAQATRDREGEVLRSQVQAFEAILNVTERMAPRASNPEVDQLNEKLDQVNAELNDLRVEVAKEVPVPSCTDLVRVLNEGES